MKLLSCYIEGYGKIKGREYRFNDDITSICEENGEGKTTLASFIKAMFYGLKGYRKGSTEFCDREHFYPFEGGLFGGNLTFEMEGKQYKIERFFGDKSETNDTVKVYENGVETNRFGEEIGKAVFSVDKESFERTIFLDSDDIEIKSTSGIHAQLNRFLVGGEDDSDVDGAKNALEKAAKVYKKSKAGNDKVSAETARIAKLNEDIQNASAIKVALEGKYARLAELQSDIERLSNQMVAAQRENEKRTQFEHYDSLNEGIKKAKTTLQEIRALYPLGIPTEEEVLLVNEYMGRVNALKAKLDGIQFSLRDGEKLAQLSGTFSVGEPSEETLLSVEEKIKSLSELKTQIKIEEEKQLSEREKKLTAKFSLNSLSSEALSAVKSRVEEYKKAKAEYEQTPALLSSAPSSAKYSLKKYAILAIVALILCVGGGAGIFFHTLIGGLALALGGILLLIDGFLYLNRKSTAAPSQSVENPERVKLEGRLRSIEDAVKATLVPYGYYSGNGIVVDFTLFQTDLAEYERFVNGETERLQRLDEYKSQADTLSRELTAFFRAYGLAGDTYIKLLSDLRLRVNDYRNLSARKITSEQNRDAVEKERSELEIKIQAFKGKYSLKEVSMSAIIEDIRSLCRLEKEIGEGEKKAFAYKLEKGLDERTTGEKVDLAELQNRLNLFQGEKSRLDREIAAEETEAEKLEGYETEKSQAEERLKEYKRKYKLLTATAQLLAQAEGRLKDKYVKPFKDEFLYYAELIEKTLGERVIVTKDFEIRFERNGIERSEKHLSAGQRSICALCFRLALIKNMYRGQLPFLILDDPFTSLDEGHMEKVSEVIRSLSKDMQTIYFTCHGSRKI